MSVVGTVESLWRYPVKSMRGEELDEIFAIDDPVLIDHLRTSIDAKPKLTLLRSDKAITDCRPISIFAAQSAKKLAEEIGIDVDKRRFRANVYLDLESAKGFEENEFVG